MSARRRDKESKDTEKRGESHVRMAADAGLRLPQPKSCLPSPASRRDKGRLSSGSFGGRAALPNLDGRLLASGTGTQPVALSPLLCGHLFRQSETRDRAAGHGGGDICNTWTLGVAKQTLVRGRVCEERRIVIKQRGKYM